MTTIAKLAANQRNAQLSTGPRTDGGKVIARMNAVNHGLRATSPTVPGECPQQWEEFRDAMLLDMDPAGALEAELAERVALLSWRMRRVSSFEAGVITRNSNNVVRQLRGEYDEAGHAAIAYNRTQGKRTLVAVRKEIESTEGNIEEYVDLLRMLTLFMKSAEEAPFHGGDALTLLREIAHRAVTSPIDDIEDFDEADERMVDVDDEEFLQGIGVPDDFLEEPQEWDGWTVARIRAGFLKIGQTAGENVAKLLARTLRDFEETLAEDRASREALKAELKAVEHETAIEEVEARKRALVANAETNEVVMRYESHLQKQFTQTLNLLKRIQALRSTFPPAPLEGIIEV